MHKISLLSIQASVNSKLRYNSLSINAIDFLIKNAITTLLLWYCIGNLA